MSSVSSSCLSSPVSQHQTASFLLRFKVWACCQTKVMANSCSTSSCCHGKLFNSFLTKTRHRLSLHSTSEVFEAMPHSACTYGARHLCATPYPVSMAGLPSIVIAGIPPRDSGRLSSVNGRSSVDDCPYRRDANEGGGDVEALHCKARLQPWHNNIGGTATSCPCACHCSLQRRSACSKSVTSCGLRWHRMQYAVLRIIHYALNMQQM